MLLTLKLLWFREDDSRIRIANAAENLSRVRRIALTLLKQETTAKMGIIGKRMKAAYDRNYSCLKSCNFNAIALKK